MTTWEQIRLIISVLLGIGISILSFSVFFLVVFFFSDFLLLILLFIFYISIIYFLVKWNIDKSNKKYFSLGISVLCLIIAAINIAYINYIQTIPQLIETETDIYKYRPFNEDSILALPEKETNYKITENMPVLDGATALYPVYAAFVNAVYPKDKYNPQNSIVLCSRTANAYINLLEGNADIIFCARPSEEQKEKFAEKELDIKFVPIGKEAFVFFVNKKNSINNLNIEDIQNIYSGKIKNWKYFGGKNKKIIAYQRPNDSGSQTALKNIMKNIPLIKPHREDVSGGMGQMINRVASYRNFDNAIGYSFLHYTVKMANNDLIKLLSINNVYPQKTTIENNSYPFIDSFYAIYIEKENMNTNIKPFIEWILSNEGRELIEKSGYVAIN